MAHLAARAVVGDGACSLATRAVGGPGLAWPSGGSGARAAPWPSNAEVAALAGLIGGTEVTARAPQAASRRFPV